MNLKLISLIGIAVANVQADPLQSQLMSIAAQEAQIANIGSNKYMMLYGTNNPIPIINRWNQIEHRPALTEDQIWQINALESQKQSVLKPVTN